MQRIISFPHMGNYYVVIKRLLSAVFPDSEVRSAPAMTNRTLELGARYSPDYVCSPFKFNIGNYIEALDGGANVLFQTGLGCRYGYFGELQEQILRDLGYDFEFVCLSRENARPSAIYRKVKELGSPLSPLGLLYHVMLAEASISVLDRLEAYMRENIGFETITGSFNMTHRAFLEELEEIVSFNGLVKLYNKYRKAFSDIPLDKPEKPLRVGVVGELYTVMDGFSNFGLERQIAANRVAITRPMSVTFLTLLKHDRLALRKVREYLRFTTGANGVDSVNWSKDFAEKGYDGVVHIKSFGCTPELSVMPALMRLSKDYDMPVIHLSFDSHTSETGVATRLEAFCDMIEERSRRSR